MAFSHQDLNPPIQRDEASLVPYREAEQIGIRHLVMTEEPFLKRLHCLRQSNLHRPEAMAWTLGDGRKQLQSLRDIYRVLVEPAIGDNPDEPRLRQRSRRP